jgi:hypothetical protein
MARVTKKGSNIMNDDDAVEGFLLEHFDGPVPDGGFCDRAMQLLPARRRRHTWPSITGVVAGGVTCFLSLLSTPLLRIGWRDWQSGQLSAPTLILLATMAGISLLALAWTTAEAYDR